MDIVNITARVTAEVLKQLGERSQAAHSNAIPPTPHPETTLDLMGAVSATANNLLSGETHTQQDRNSFQSASLPPGHSLPLKLKHKIWDLELSTLQLSSHHQWKMPTLLWLPIAQTLPEWPCPPQHPQGDLKHTYVDKHIHHIGVGLL